MADTRLSRDGRSITVRVPMTFTKRGGRKLVVTPGGVSAIPSPRPRIDSTLVKALARAFRWRKMLETGAFATVDDIVVAENIDATYVSRILRLTLLAPDIVEAALDGRQPPGLALARVMRAFAPEWEVQREMFGVVA